MIEDEYLYDLYENKEDPFECIAYVKNAKAECFGDYEVLHKVEKALIDDGYAIIKAEYPFIFVNKVTFKKGANDD